METITKGAELLNDPELFLAIEDLEIAAQGIVQGAWQGLRRSPWRGSGVEFDSHREYRQGDDPRHINWALSSRHKRLYMKEYRAETNLPLYLMLDATASMGVANGPSKKFAYAARAAAALAWLAQQQRDATGLALLRTAAVDGLPARGGKMYFERVIAEIAGAEPEGKGDIAGALEGAREHFRARGVAVLFSDLFDKEESVLHTLRCMREQGHEVIVFQVLDPMEVELPKDADLEFEDAETGERMRTSTAGLREAYAAAVDRWREDFGARCDQAGIDWVTTTTEESLVKVVQEVLMLRMRR